MADNRFFSTLLRLEEVDSTNRYLLEEAYRLPDRTVLIAHRQTKGRGRRGREWETEPGALTFSVLFRALPPHRLTTLPLLAGLCGAEGIARLTGCSPRLKWPNDLLVRGKKTGGILCESRSGTDGTLSAVCGMGINLTADAEWFADRKLPQATSLLAEGYPVEGDALLAGIEEAFARRYESFLQEGFASFSPQYRAFCDTVGQPIFILDGTSSRREGTALGISEDGGLICRIGDREEVLHSGEVSVRPRDICSDF